jgi:hypothetical protein
MKRLVTLLLLFLPLMMTAQEIETLTQYKTKADQMTKMDGATKWRSEHVGVTLWDSGVVGMGLMNPPHIFIGKRAADRSRLPYNYCKVGLYTKDGTLVWLAEKWKCQPGEGGTVLYFTVDAKAENQQTGEKRKITTADILSWLQHTGNYVRYIADVYGDYYWDVSGKFSE